MRAALKFILLLAIAFSFAWLPSMYRDFKEMIGEPELWIGEHKGVDTMVHFFVMVAAFLYLILQTIPASIGWVFAFNNRKAAFGLLLLPGFIGLIVAGAIFGLLYKFDPLWRAAWSASAIIGLPALVYFFIGQLIMSRK